MAAACGFPLGAIGCLASAYEHFFSALLAQALLSGTEKLVTSRIAAAPRFLVAFGLQMVHRKLWFGSEKKRV